MKVLFLCTGNYYRSRMAEELLRGYSIRQGINIESDSAALGIIPNPINIGPIRQEAADYLKKTGCLSEAVMRFPRKCTARDLESSDIIIGMNEPEHRHMVEDQFPGIAEQRVRYWNVPDMDEDPGFIGPDLINTNVMRLLEEIRSVKA